MNEKNKKQSSEKYTKWLLIGLIIAILVICVIWLINRPDNNKASNEWEKTLPNTCNNVQDVSFVLDQNLKVTELGSYSGNYIEDGSDEEVSDVMMIIVSNEGEETLQYAEITLTSDAGDAIFKFSTLCPGESMMVLEANRKNYSSKDSYVKASIANVVFFSESLSLYEDQLEIQPLDGGFNIINISEKDINGVITVYFKNSDNNILYGGITYRSRIEGNLEAGEIRQVMSEHFYSSGTEVMFITITEE